MSLISVTIRLNREGVGIYWRCHVKRRDRTIKEPWCQWTRLFRDWRRAVHISDWRIVGVVVNTSVAEVREFTRCVIDVDEWDVSRLALQSKSFEGLLASSYLGRPVTASVRSWPS